ncbi:IclR family transcriptional regulator [Streptomyces radicis]|uniref:Glycerol operon regulatory protein n=1 Tax=Streptomyces radicis TaxID=1750517 RepID=A0A3A9WWQ3_9ACTN|nr:IclR family transcriptional regulator [Streptomyces radicis]RKN12236.1 IclR family transcriptional regulator [Streptomyces radicis]RKN26088.1 IclR family transcriptional regulator [Streptomyces radicis]
MADGADDRRGSAGSVQSVERAVALLEVLARSGASGVTEIADELGVHKSTASRLIGVLESRGLVDQEKERGKYFLGVGILRLAGAAAMRLDISQESAPVCRLLAEETGETANVAVLDGDAAVNIMQARGRAEVSAYNWLGRRTPLHATASGKVLLAALPANVRDGLMTGERERFTRRTVTAPAALRAEIAQVVAAGFAVTREELEEGLSAVAAPVRRFDGTVIGAIGVSGPVYRMGEERLSELAESCTAAGDELSRRMGFGG